MAQSLQNITITAPAFKGLNTQDSPLSGDVQYASIADNVVIDKYGRIGARNGLESIATSAALGSAAITKIHQYENESGDTELLSIGNGQFFKGDTSLQTITPSGYSIANENYGIVNFNDNTYFFNADQDALVYNDIDGLGLVSDVTGASSFIPSSNVVLSAFGRLWAVDEASGRNKVYWSDLLIGHSWTTGSSGSLDLDKVWADGADQVTALAVWNNYLVIFGRNSIVLYQGADSPANMTLADTISGVGCIAKNTVRPTGNDLLFLSSRGVMALGRTIQEKSNPINDVSRNVRNDLTRLVALETQDIEAVYSGSQGFYLLLLKDSGVIYCFDTKGLLENGSYRVTRWIADKFKSLYVTQDDKLLVGNTSGVNEYKGYKDNNEKFSMRYYSNPLSFGDPSHIKLVKKLVPTLIGSTSEQVYMKWSYDFNDSYRTQAFSLFLGANIGYFSESEYNTDVEFVSGNNSVTTKRINATGSGNLVTVGLETEINGGSLSIQEFNIQAIIGKTY